MNNEIKSIFEYEIKRKISERARSPADEFRILMNGFKFYDYNNTGKVNKTEFVKGILRSGLSGFNESDLLSLFSCYDLSNSGFVDYKNFCNYLYGREPLKGTSNSQNETQNQTQTTIDESIYNNQRQKTPIVNPNDNMNANNNNQNNQNISGQQNINQAPAEQMQNQQNIDPNQTKEYFHKLIISIKDQINTNNGLTYYTFLFEVKNNSDQNQTITIENFVNVFKNIGLNIPQNDISNLFNLLDFSQTGKVIIDDIINTIVDPMNEHRKLYVVNKFAKLDLEKQGEVRISLLKEKYNPKGHPDVISGKISDEEIYKQFCYTLDIYCSIRMITDTINYKQFIEYYNGISSAIFDENYFEAILNVWDDDIINANPNNNTNTGKIANNTINNNMENNSQQPQMNNNVNMNMRMNDENRTINNYNNAENQISNNERYTIDQNNNHRFGRKNNNINNTYSTNDIGINSLFLGESTHVLPKSFGRRNFKRYRPNFNPQSPNNYNNNKNNNQYPSNNVEANNVQSTNMIQNNNNNRNNFNKTPISQNQAFQGNQNQKNNQNNYDEINNFNDIMNNEKQYQMKVNYNPITNVYTPNRDINTQKTPLNQNMNNNITNENASLNSTNNTADNTQNNEAQIKELIINSLNKLKSNFIFGGSHILFSFQRKLSMYDINHKGLISLNNFLSVAQSYTMLSQDELKIIFDLFDKDKAGSINYNELIQTIIEPVSSNRKLIIKKIYDSFNKDNNGKVSINEIKLSFNPRRHPDVISGKKSEGEIFGEFLDNIESYREYLENMKGVYDNNMSLEDFINFYVEVGVGIEDDKIFEFMINNCWSLDNNNNNFRPRNTGEINNNKDIGLSGNRYRNNNNNGFGYRNNGNNNINSGNMMVRAGSQIINSKGY